MEFGNSIFGGRKTVMSSLHEFKCPKMALKDEDSSITMSGTRAVTGPTETGSIISLMSRTHTLHAVILPRSQSPSSI